MKKILYIHQYFKTPHEPGGTRSYWVSQALIKSGCHVTMLTSRNSQKKLIERLIVDNIHVIYVRNSYDNSYGIFRRFWSFVRFVILSSMVALKEKNVHLVYATSTPLTIGIPALMVKWVKQIPFVFEVRDLWPEVPIQMGALKNKILRYVALWLEKRIYEKAKHIIALSPGMKAGVLKRSISEDKVSMVPNMAKIDKFYKRSVKDVDYDAFGLKKNNFHVIHFGAMGRANGIDYIIDAAEILREEKYLKFLFVGSGSEEAAIKEDVVKRKLTNVQFVRSLNMKEMSQLVNLCDCSIVSFLDITILQTNSPNKLFDSLSAQKPIIVNSAGWTKDLVEKYKCGAYVDPQDPSELAQLLIKWKNNDDLICAMGRASRELAEKKYDKSILTKQIVDIINTIVI